MRRRSGERLLDVASADRDRGSPDRQALLEAVFDAAPDCLVMIGGDGLVVEANAAARSTLPLLEPGRPLARCFAAASQLGLQTALTQSLAGQRAQVDCALPDDEARTLALVLSPLAAGSGHVLATLRPLEREQADSEIFETVGRLAGGVAHDFNNILTVVIGNSELLAERLAADPEARRLAEISRDAARTGADLTRMLLAYSRRQALQPSEFCPADLLADMRGLLERSLGETIALALHWDTPPWGVRVDRAQLANVVLNLALNARDAMRRGGCLTIETRHRAAQTPASAGNRADGDHVTIAVSDTGTGIPPAVLARVFEPFFTTKAPGKGSGLGLAMVQGFAHQSGGFVEIASQPGAGTAVKLHLPRAQIQLRLPVVDTVVADSLARAGEKVLVVDDNAALRGLIAAQLETLGYGVTTATDGRAALAVLRQGGRFDLLLTDIVMPGLDGLALARRAHRLRPGLKVLLTSAQPDQRAGRTLLFGPLLPKPFAREDLARRVRATIDGKLS